jgi:hypothetical protein
MVEIAVPPPLVQPQPRFYTVTAGTRLIRMYDPTMHEAAPTRFRFYGPLRRFDHQIEVDEKPALSEDRGIMYAGDTLSGCLVEIFGDSRMIEVGSWEVAVFEPTRDLKLMDLRGEGAMKAGTVAAICKDSDHKYSQIWSRYFYENKFIYEEIDGLIFQNAHNEETAFALYERCQADLSVLKTGTLKDQALRTQIELIAARLGMVVDPYRTA